MAPPKAGTIFAVASGGGKGAIAVIRVSGPNASEVFKCCGKVSLPKARMATLCSFRDLESGVSIDTCLTIWFPGPQSFTGEDVVELHVHGGRAVVAGVFRSLSKFTDFRPAEPGEFTRRAFVNGKLDLLEAEGIGQVIAADTQKQLAYARALSDGEFSRKVEGWETRLRTILSFMAGLIDFSDEDDVSIETSKVAEACRSLARDFELTIASSERGYLVRNGISVVLAGRPNVGKSSLLNALTRRDVAIVSTRAGTTRDVIEVQLCVGEIPVSLADTAGLGTTTDEIEKEGIRRSKTQIGKANLVVWVSEAGHLEEPNDFVGTDVRVIKVANKSDISDVPEGDAWIGVSAITGSGIDLLLERIERECTDCIGSVDDTITILDRHRAALNSALASLRAIDGLWNYPELVMEELHQVAAKLDELIGAISPEDILDQVFASFCIGK
jgi:tRNA modification GTPase